MAGPGGPGGEEVLPGQRCSKNTLSIGSFNNLFSVTSSSIILNENVKNNDIAIDGLVSIN